MPDELSNSFSKFKQINDEISTALYRGDAEGAPTYEEFMVAMGKIMTEFRAVYEEYED